MMGSSLRKAVAPPEITVPDSHIPQRQRLPRGRRRDRPSGHALQAWNKTVFHHGEKFTGCTRMAQNNNVLDILLLRQQHPSRGRNDGRPLPLLCWNEGPAQILPLRLHQEVLCLGTQGWKKGGRGGGVVQFASPLMGTIPLHCYLDAPSLVICMALGIARTLPWPRP